MLRQSFSEEQVVGAAQRLGFELDPETPMTVLPSRRGSVARLLTSSGIVLMKYADLQYAPAEEGINLARSTGIRNEARQLQRLRGNLAPRLLGYLDEPNAVCAATEFIKGPTVDIAAQAGQVNKNLLVKKLVRAVGSLHARGILHGDIQPTNAIVGGGRALTLIDFEFSHDLDEPGLAPGLHRFLSPEAAQALVSGDKPCLNQKEETFALTATCLSLLTSRPPIDFGTVDLLSEDELMLVAHGQRYNPVGAEPGDMPLALQLTELLESAPAHRPETPPDLLKLIKTAAGPESRAS